MTTLETLQIVGACLALILQLIATLLTKPIRQLLPQKLWWFVFSLNFLELIRRILILCSVTDYLGKSAYQSVTVVFGLIVSTSFLLLMRELSKPKTIEKDIVDLAKQTVEKVKSVKAEESLAYKLATHFIDAKEGHVSK